jgi:hypothetical protein
MQQCMVKCKTPSMQILLVLKKNRYMKQVNLDNVCSSFCLCLNSEINSTFSDEDSVIMDPSVADTRQLLSLDEFSRDNMNPATTSQNLPLLRFTAHQSPINTMLSLLLSFTLILVEPC